LKPTGARESIAVTGSRRESVVADEFGQLQTCRKVPVAGREVHRVWLQVQVVQAATLQLHAGSAPQ
jgi:hypothetical protein